MNLDSRLAPTEVVYSTSEAVSGGFERLDAQFVGAHRRETLRGRLIALCSSDWEKFEEVRQGLKSFPLAEIQIEAVRMTRTNARSLRMVAIVFEPSFLLDWQNESIVEQLNLFRVLAFDSINPSMKEHAFLRVAALMRKDVLSQSGPACPMKLRLRDCDQSIAAFMSEYAALSAVNKGIVVRALLDIDANGGGHLPVQYARALLKRLSL